MMKDRLLFRLRRLSVLLLAAAGIVMIAGTRAGREGEKLPVANGTPEKGILPADVRAAEIGFETATFGLG